MAPRYRGGSGRGSTGDSDDWLDDQEAGRTAAGKPKKKSSKSGPLDPSLANATVTEVFPNQCRVRPDQVGPGLSLEILCSYRRAQVMQSAEEALRERSPVAVGDRVLVEAMNPQSGVVQGVVSRKNYLARPAPGKDDPSLIHVIAANIDLLVIVASVTLPEFSPGLVDRYLIASQAAGIPALLCITKSDLMKSERAPLWEAYGDLGYPWILLSTRRQSNGVLSDPNGISALRQKVSGKTVVFCGHSGVGKTSVFRAILGREIGRVGEVNEQTGKGRHTTTSSILYSFAENDLISNWIDTPGIREFGLLGVKPDTLGNYFPELVDLECTRNGCVHIAPNIAETGCQATDLLRYGSYVRIFESLSEALSKGSSK